MNGDKVAKQLEKDVAAYKAGFADGYRAAKAEQIRCKDCKYYKVYEMFDHTLPLCNRVKTTMADALEEDDYCSRAERREE